MPPREPETVAAIDWRINGLTWTTAPFTSPNTGAVIPAGATVIQVAFAKCGQDDIGLAIPNATALFLNLSRTHHEEAKVSLDKALAEKDASHQVPHADIFSCIERMMASTVFACTALESFVNETIPDDYVHAVDDGKCTRHYSKEQIERTLTLDEKLGAVLPKALNVESPKSRQIWHDYQKLRGLRDRIVHMKAKDREVRGQARESIWHELITKPLREPHKPAKAMIGYFFSKTAREAPRWFQKCPT